MRTLCRLPKKHEGLRLAIVWNIADGKTGRAGGHPVCEPIEIPEPLTIPFEPILFESGQSLLTGLREARLLRQKRPPAPEARPRGGRISKAIRRTLEAVLIVFAIPVVLAIVGVLLIVIGPILWMVSLFVRTEWFLTPGAAIRRRILLWSSRPRLLLFTPASHILGLRHESHLWRAEFWLEGRCAAAVSGVDPESLLAAWQSPLAPPRVNELEDLI